MCWESAGRVLKLTEGLPGRRGGAGLEGNTSSRRIRGLGIRVGPRPLWGLGGNVTSAESSGGPGPQAAENWRC